MGGGALKPWGLGRWAGGLGVGTDDFLQSRASFNAFGKFSIKASQEAFIIKKITATN